jgi:hypothetical protein
MLLFHDRKERPKKLLFCLRKIVFLFKNLECIAGLASRLPQAQSNKNALVVNNLRFVLFVFVDKSWVGFHYCTAVFAGSKFYRVIKMPKMR